MMWVGERPLTITERRELTSKLGAIGRELRTTDAELLRVLTRRRELIDARDAILARAYRR